MRQNKKVIILIIFIAVAIIQVAAPLSMIFENEEIVEKGKAYKFETRPMDPYDPFRGKYIRLYFSNNRSIKVKHPELWVNKQIGYFPVLINSRGFAYVEEVLIDAPENGDYLKMEVSHYSSTDSSVYYQYPFDRFYMNENEALDAEKAYREVNRDRQKANAYALVMIKDGNAVLQDVIIGGISAKELN